MRGALLAGERQRRPVASYKVARKVDASNCIVKPRERMARCSPWHLVATRASLRGWLVSRDVGPVVDRGGRHACAHEPLPVNISMIAHHASRTLTTIRLYPTRLETRTKESNMCASLWVIETRGQNESKGGLGC